MKMLLFFFFLFDCLFETSKYSVRFQLKYKEDLMWLRGLGCFLYDTPEMVHVRNITKQRVRDGTLHTRVARRHSFQCCCSN